MPFDVVTYIYATRRGAAAGKADTTKYIVNQDATYLVSIISRMDISEISKFLNNITPSLVRSLLSSGLPNALSVIDSWLANPSINYDNVAAAIDGSDVPASGVAALLDAKLSSGAITVDAVATLLASSQLSVSKLYSILANMGANNVQSVLYRWVSDLALDRLIDLLTYGAPSATLNANVTFTGVNRFNVLNLNGYTYTADGQPHVIIAQSINVPASSSIAKTPTGGAGGLGPASGGRGGGGLIILTKSMTVAGTISADGARGSNYGSGSGRGGGGGAGAMPTVFSLSPGNGSNTCSYGYGNNAGGAPGAGAGGGYDNSVYDAGGPGGTVSLTNYSTINDFIQALVRPIVDWYTANILGKTPATTSAFPACYGAGGGGGGTCGGGGGGSGGFMFIYSPSLSLTGTLSASGGGGGDANTSISYCFNGGGGGGGLIFVVARGYVPQSKILVNGGSLGAPRCGSASTPGSFAVMWP